mmetsp:Transcript_14381/g.28710  ORF Transcript_14381/g.28710 Transcript_14381/m.28710 type:complete len:376 (+) Transcript_14381:196-1323(+)
MNWAKASTEKINESEQQQQQQQQQQKPSDLSSFSLAAAIDEARSQPRRIFNALSPFAHKRQPSQQSIATNTSFATAHESIVNESTATPAASSIADSSSDDDDDDTDQEELTFGNDPIAVISQSNHKKSRAPCEISFSNDIPPEETVLSSSPDDHHDDILTMAKKSSANNTAKKTATPETLPVANSITAETTTTMTTPIPETKPTVIEPPPPKPSPSPPTSPPPEALPEEAHFDLAQQVYGATKHVWSWGKTVPVLSNLLGLTEHVAAGILDKTVKMKLETLDSDVAAPKLKELDDRVVTPVILAVWRIVGPVVGKGDEMVVKPVMTGLVPRILGPLGLDGKKKMKEDGGRQAVLEKTKVSEEGPNPEYTSAPMVN